MLHDVACCSGAEGGATPWEDREGTGTQTWASLWAGDAVATQAPAAQVDLLVPSVLEKGWWALWPQGGAWGLSVEPWASPLATPAKLGAT